MRRLGLALTFLAIIILGSISSPAAYALPEVEVSLVPERGPADGIFLLDITISGASGSVSNPRFQSSTHFTLNSVGTSSRKQYDNGVFRAEITFSFQVTVEPSLSPGSYKLPQGVIDVSGTVLEISPQPIEITASAPAATNNNGQVAAHGGAVSFVQVVDSEKAYVGQQILYRAEVASTDNFLGGNIDDVEPAGFWREKLDRSNDESTRKVGNVTIRSFAEVLFPSKAGDLVIPERKLFARIRAKQTRSDPLGIHPGFRFPWLNVDRSYERTLSAPAVSVSVKPLPPPPAETGPYIPVGTLKARSAVSPEKITQGDSVNLTITVWGDANLRPFELQKSLLGGEKDFKRYDDKPTIRTAYKNGRLTMYKVFRIALVPLRAGELEIPSFVLVSFNPELEQYEVRTIPKKIVTVIANKEEQELQLTAPAGMAEQPEPAAVEKTITFLGEDLLPQHVGAHTLRSSPQFSSNLLWAIIVLLPLTAGLLRWQLQRRLLAKSDPQLALERQAYGTAQGELNKLGNLGNPEQLRSLLTKYLSHRLRCKAENMTAKEVAALIHSKTGQSELGAELERYLEQIDRYVYSGASSTTQISAQASLVSTTAQLIARIEQSLGGRRK